MEQVSSIFGQILRFFPRAIFNAAVHKHQGDKHAKGMSCWVSVKPTPLEPQAERC